MIDLAAVTVRLGKRTVVDDLTFAVARGERVALWGENGAGKTTVIRAMLGLLPFSGTATVAGHDVRRSGRRARAAIGYVPQQLALYDELTAIGYLRFMGGLRHAPADQPSALLARVGLSEHAAKPVGALSGGMRQRLALAGALLGDPPVLVLDEPTASLDAAARTDFQGLLGELNSPEHTLLITSHRLEEVAALADRVLVLRQGRLVESCLAHDLARTLRLEATLRLLLSADVAEEALAVLGGLGYSVRRNGRGLLVQVAPGQRAAPVRALVEHGITVDDLAIEEGTWTPG
jgi:ABC-type multidrug transport system ATPase subunit